MWLISSRNSQSCVCLWSLWSILVIDHKGGGGNNLNSSFTPNTLFTLLGALSLSNAAVFTSNCCSCFTWQMDVDSPLSRYQFDVAHCYRECN